VRGEGGIMYDTGMPSAIGESSSCEAGNIIVR
jgi:hypothetical protein